MFERFTEKAIKVIMLSQDEARRLGHSFIGTEELLLGLIGQRSGKAAKTLLQLGINLRTVRRTVESIVGRGSGYQAIEIPFTERARTSLEFALEAAHQLNSEGVDTEHLLLGILRVEDSVANMVLENLGVDVSNLQAQLLQPGDAEVNSEDEVTTSASPLRLTEPTTSDSELLRQVESLTAKLSEILSEAEAIRQMVRDSSDTDDTPDTDVDESAYDAFNRNITGRLERLPDTQSSEQLGIKEALIALRTQLSSSLELTTIDKVEALEQIRFLAEASRNPSNLSRQKIARLAIKILRGTITILPPESSLHETSRRYLLIAAQYFRLNDP